MAELHFTFVEQVITSLAGKMQKEQCDLSLVSFEQRDGCRQVMEWRGGNRLVGLVRMGLEGMAWSLGAYS